MAFCFSAQVTDGKDVTEIKNKKVRLIELFAGYGSQAMAMRRLGVDFESHFVCEFDQKAIESYNAVHGTNYHTIDIRDVHAKDLNITDRDKYTYVMFYSSPCFTGDTLVLTKDGYKPIKSIKVGDTVLSHDCKYHAVTASAKTGHKPIMKLEAMCTNEIRATENHKFYVRKRYRKWHRNIRKFTDPTWVELKDLTRDYYVGVPINQESKLPKWDGVTSKWSDRNRTETHASLKKLFTNHSFWYVMGYCVGDGWTDRNIGIRVCGTQNKLKPVYAHIRNLGLKALTTHERTVDKVSISSVELAEFTKQFGKGALNKRIPGFVFDLPKEYVKSFIEGCLQACGYTTSSGIHKISSISSELVHGIGMLVAKAYNQPFKVYKTKRRPTCVIEGRTCNQHDSYELTWKENTCNQDKAFVENGMIWCPIRKIHDLGETADVYDITVDGSHSFVANNATAHNCQDISVAGKQAGLEKGSGTRSGLLWEVERLLEELQAENALPQVLFMENVSAILQDKFKSGLDQWRTRLNMFGYTNNESVLNAKNYGVPQNRERFFMVSFLGKRAYEFPHPVKLDKCIKDVLEENVDKSYFLDDSRIQQLMAITDRERLEQYGYRIVE